MSALAIPGCAASMASASSSDPCQIAARTNAVRRSLSSVSDARTRLLAGSCAVFDQEGDDRFELRRLRHVESGAAVGVRDVDVDAEFDRELDGFEGERFAPPALRLNPGGAAAH